MLEPIQVAYQLQMPLERIHTALASDVEVVLGKLGEPLEELDQERVSINCL